MALSSPYRTITQTRRAISGTVLRVVEDHRQAVGARLRDLRKSRGMSQMDAATAVGVQLKTWGDWERGKRDPYDQNWRKIGETFDIDPAAVRGTLPAPLGLGAREEQVEVGFEEFRAYVRDINAKLDAAAEEREAMQALINQQNVNLAAHAELLAEQSRLLRELRRAVAGLPALQEALDLLREEDVAARASRDDSAPAEAPGAAKARRRRRRTG